MKRIVVPVFILTATIAILMIMVTTASADLQEDGVGENPIGTDLVVERGTTEHFTNDHFILNGNIVVEGTLILENTTILMNSTYNGEFGITVSSTGRLLITSDSVIRPGEAKTLGEGNGETYHYSFQVLSEGDSEGSLELTDSTITGAGYLSTHPERCGIYLSSSDVILSNSVIENSYYGLIFSQVEGPVLIRETLFRENSIGITLDRSSGFRIEGNEFYGNDRALTVSRSDDIAIVNNEFTGNRYGVRLDNTTNFHIENNVFEDNEFTGIHSEFSTTGTIQGNEITGTITAEKGKLGSAITMRSSSHVTIGHNTLMYNSIGIMLVHESSDINAMENFIRGGRLGIYLYQEHLENRFTDITISETKEAALNVRHSSGQVFEDITFNANRALDLNISASDIDIINPVFDSQGIDHHVGEASTVLISSEFRVRALEYNGIPLPNSEVMVMNDGRVEYASSMYHGPDRSTDKMGMTDWIQMKYLTLHDGIESPSEIEIFASWNGMEESQTITGEFDKAEILYFRIPDLTLDNSDITITSYDPYSFESVSHDPISNEPATISLAITNLGSASIKAEITTYLVPGIWTIHEEFSPGNQGTGTGVGTGSDGGLMGLPFNAVLIDATEITADRKRNAVVEFEWIPGPEGDYTIVSIIDENAATTELRKDNNVAYTQVTVRSEDLSAPGPAGAIISLEMPDSLDGSTMKSSVLTLTPTIMNSGEVTGTIILQGKLTNDDETIQIYRQIISMSPGQRRELEIPVDMPSGDTTITFTIMQYDGDENLDILNPILSFMLHVEKANTYPGGEENEPIVPEVVLYSSVAGTVSFIIAMLAFAESSRYRILLFLVPLYMRMSKKDISEHYTRGEILGYIKQNPGESYNNIKRDLEMSNGKLAYHLSVLEKGGFIKSVTDGMYRRYYSKKIKVSTYGRITSVQEELLRRIQETPGITQKDLSKIVSLSTATINYHMRKLTQKELIFSKRTGIFIHYYLTEGLTIENIMVNAISSSRRAKS